MVDVRTAARWENSNSGRFDLKTAPSLATSRDPATVPGGYRAVEKPTGRIPKPQTMSSTEKLEQQHKRRVLAIAGHALF